MAILNFTFAFVIAFLFSSASAGENISFEKWTHLPSKTTYQIVTVAPSQKSIGKVLFLPGSDSTSVVKGEKGGKKLKSHLLKRMAISLAGEGYTAIYFLPSEKDQSGFNYQVRASKEHQAALKDFVTHLEGRLKGPLFVVAMSRGALSAYNLGTLTDLPVDGYVFAAALADSRWVVPFINAVDKETVLFIHHRQDMCRATRFDELSRVVLLKGAKLHVVTGGVGKVRSLCKSGFHQFAGVEKEVINQSRLWIESLTKK